MDEAGVQLSFLQLRSILQHADGLNHTGKSPVLLRKEEQQRDGACLLQSFIISVEDDLSAQQLGCTHMII